ncbi:HNH endonuclease [Aquipuribacter nitratireducens]|uniref:DUF222 domain-containing protein n=1 Tax=Aquipuribacter nitratireducens TaxID=650104 RepID=A0ABW0GPH4_9MICO
MTGGARVAVPVVDGPVVDGPVLDGPVVDGDDLADSVAAGALRTASASVRARAAVEAAELQALATLVRVRREQALAEDPRVDLELVEQCVATEVSLALSLSQGGARGRVALAEELLRRRPATFAAMLAGRVDLVRARRVCDAVRHLPLTPVRGDAALGMAGHETLAEAVEAEVLEPGSVPALADARPGRPAGELSPPQLTARLARLVHRADAAGAAERCEQAQERRRCTLVPVEDGMALLQVLGRADLMAAAYSRLDGTARQLQREVAAAGGPRRTLDQTRVDVLTAMLLGESDTLARARGVQVELAVVAPAATVLGEARTQGPDHYEDPGELLGVGPLPAPLVRELATTTSWRRWLADPHDGHVTGVGRRTYRPSAAVARFVRARDGGCGMPHCRRAGPRSLDLDHVVPFAAGGETTKENLRGGCRCHHRVKHARHAGSGFTASLAPDGTLTWTTPTGSVHVEPPTCWLRAPSTGPEPGALVGRDVGRDVGPAAGSVARPPPASPALEPTTDPDPPPF